MKALIWATTTMTFLANNSKMATTEQAPIAEIKQIPHQMYNQRAHGTLPKNPGEASALLRSYIPDYANPITAQLSYGNRAIPNLVNFINGTMFYTCVDSRFKR